MIPVSDAAALYRALLLPRLVEEKMLRLLRQGKLSKWFSGIGQEAIAVGLTAALADTDVILPLHRNLGVFTTRGVDLERLFRKLLFREGGFTGGRDRTFHFGVLDHHIVEFAMEMPSRLKYRDGVGKWLLRQAITGLVPPRVLSHPKHGFGVPLARWFRDELRYRLEALQRPEARIGPYVDASAVARLIDEHHAGRRDHSHLLWRLLVLEVWLTALAEGRLAHASPLADAVRGAAAAGIVNAVTA